MSAVADAEETGLELIPLGSPFHITERGLVMNHPPSFEQAQEAAGKLKKVHESILYWIGDIAHMCEGLFHEEASQIIDQAWIDEKTVAACRFVSEKVSPKVRALAPSWEHARAVAALPEKQQEKWLQKALDEEWIASKLKSEIQSEAVGGESKMRFLLIVDCGTEAKQDALAKSLEKDGFSTTKRAGVKKEAKPKKKLKGEKKKEITARGKKRGVVKPYARRRR